METFRAYAYKDAFGRLTIVSSTQVPFHVRRVVANALKSRNRRSASSSRVSAAVLAPSRLSSWKSTLLISPG